MSRATAPALTAVAQFAWGNEASRARLAYVLVSAAACGVDFFVTLSLTASHAPAWFAAASGYTLGLALHWSLSSRFVFARELAPNAAARRRQAAMFVLSGLVGLGVTVGIYSAATTQHIGAAPAKALAVVISFALVYALRRYLIFPARP